MLFSIIYSVDVPEGENVLRFAPPDMADLWQETESDDCYEYGYLGDEWGENGHHRKWCGILDRDQFEHFLNETGLFAENVQTMGSIGAPGFGYGWAPAISFRSDDPDAILSAYVTPLPETRKEGGDERDWDRVRSAVLAVYG